MRYHPHDRMWHAAWLALGALALPGQATLAAPMYDVQAVAYPTGFISCDLIAFTDAQWIVVDCNGGGTEGAGYHRTLPGPWAAIPAPDPRYFNNTLVSASDAGMVVGYHFWQNWQRSSAPYTWSIAGGYHYLSRATEDGEALPEGINDLGQVVGKEGRNAMLWSADGSVAYRDPARHGRYEYSSAGDISNAGEVVAYSTERGPGIWTSPGDERAVRVDGRRVALGPLNQMGQSFGNYTVHDHNGRDATQLALVNYRDSTSISVGLPLRKTLVARDLNDAGQVTYAVLEDGYNYAGPVTVYYWDEMSGNRELLSLVNPASPLIGTMDLRFRGLINAVGQILVPGEDKHTGENYLYLFTPVAP